MSRLLLCLYDDLRLLDVEVHVHEEGVDQFFYDLLVLAEQDLYGLLGYLLGL